MTERIKEAKSDATLFAQALKDPLPIKRPAEVLTNKRITLLYLNYHLSLTRPLMALQPRESGLSLPSVSLPPEGMPTVVLAPPVTMRGTGTETGRGLEIEPPARMLLLGTVEVPHLPGDLVVELVAGVVVAVVVLPLHLRGKAVSTKVLKVLEKLGQMGFSHHLPLC